MSVKPEPLVVPSAINLRWSMGFMHNQPGDRRSYRLLNVIDDFNRKRLSIEMDLSLLAEWVVRTLDQAIEWCDMPAAICCDNGPGCTSDKLAERGGWLDDQSS